MIKELALFNASVIVLFSLYSLLEIHKRSYIFYTLKSETAVVLSETTVCKLDQCRLCSLSGFCGSTPEGNLTLEKGAIYDWLSSTCEIEELGLPVFLIYDFISLCLFQKV